MLTAGQWLEVNAATYDCIIFYRWFTRDGKQERGRVMARLIAEVLESMGVAVWLDQHEMSRSSTREQVLDGIRKAFQRVRYVVILAAPGDWDRFVDHDDIHQWEWEMSLKSDKPVWVLQYDTCPEIRPHPIDLAHRMSSFSVLLAGLVLRRAIEVRTIMMDNVDATLQEVVGCNDATKIIPVPQVLPYSVDQKCPVKSWIRNRGLETLVFFSTLTLYSCYMLL
ncbi:hypothetical protein WG66_001931 [Moniliophthora roreri]|nr:hypothetical protein WG66_001931 [Moniliophthora roreri]